jgi:hypothetical protein
MPRIEGLQVQDYMGDPHHIALHRYDASDKRAVFSVFRYGELPEIRNVLEAIGIPGGRAARVVIQNPKYEEPVNRTVTRHEMLINSGDPKRPMTYEHVETLGDAVKMATANWGAGTDKDNIIGASILQKGIDTRQVLFDPADQVPLEQIKLGSTLNITIAGDVRDMIEGDPVNETMQALMKRLSNNHGITFAGRFSMHTSGKRVYTVSHDDKRVDVAIPTIRQYAGGSANIETFKPDSFRPVTMPSWLFSGMDQEIRRSNIPARGTFYS